MRLPNGYGSVAKLSGNRRRPYVVKKTIGWNEKGHPISKTIGYVATREEGLILLANYNKSPWNIDAQKITLSELYNLWLEKKSHRLGTSNLGSLKSAYHYIKSYDNTKYRDIKSYHMQETIDYCKKSPSTKATIKNLWYHLDKFALEMDITSNNYSSILELPPQLPTSRDRFSQQELDSLFAAFKTTRNNPKFELLDIAIILLYTGFRAKECLELKIKNVNLCQGTFTGGLKTAAGKNRVVPIHDDIMHLVKARYNKDNEYLFMYNGKPLKYSRFKQSWDLMMEKLNIKKVPHECRHTFESVLDSNGANRRCIDLLMGHVSKDTGNKVYNHKTLDELKNAINLLDFKLTTN